MKDHSIARYGFQVSGGHFLYGERIAEWVHNKYFKKQGKILDIGSSRGRFGKGFLKLGYDVVGIDNDPSAIDFINRNYKGKDFKGFNVNLEGGKFPFPDNTFDYIFCRNVIEHVFLFDNFYNEIKRVMKPNALGILITCDWANSYLTFWDSLTHYRPYSKATCEAVSDFYEFEMLNQLRPIGLHYKFLDINIPCGEQDIVYSMVYTHKRISKRKTARPKKPVKKRVRRKRTIWDYYFGR